MNIRRRMRSTIKWGGAAVAVLLLTAWIASGRCIVNWILYPTGIAAIDRGRVSLLWFEPLTSPASSRFEWEHAAGFQPSAWFDFKRRNRGDGSTATQVIMPLWSLTLVAAMPTFLIWRRDRKPKPNTCTKCGYSRTGLPADRACPECGCTTTVVGPSDAK